MPRTDARWGAWALVLVVLVLCVCPGAAGTPPYGDAGRGDGHDDRTHASHVTYVTDVTRAIDVTHAVHAMYATHVTRAVDATYVTHATHVVGTAHPVASPVRGEGRPPGCRGDSRADDGGLAPAAPPRGLTPGDLLPAPHDARGASGLAAWTAWEPAATGPERAPPPLVPPSPMDLSILRV